MADHLWTPQEAAAYLHVALQTLAQWRWRRIGPPYRKVGPRLVRYAQADLEAWLAGQAQEPAPVPVPLPAGPPTGGLVLTLPPRRCRG